MAEPRVILYHKQATSARTRFLLLGHGGVCGPTPLPKLSAMIDDPDDAGEARTVVPHPALALKTAERALGLSSGALELDGEYEEYVDTPDGATRVFLAHFTATDPPFEAMAAHGAAFIALTEARRLPDTELLLLRRAYELVLG